MQNKILKSLLDKIVNWEEKYNYLLEAWYKKYKRNKEDLANEVERDFLLNPDASAKYFKEQSIYGETEEEKKRSKRNL